MEVIHCPLCGILVYVGLKLLQGSSFADDVFVIVALPHCFPRSSTEAIDALRGHRLELPDDRAQRSRRQPARVMHRAIVGATRRVALVRSAITQRGCLPWPVDPAGR